MYDLFITLCGVPEDVFADSIVLQEWFSVCSCILTCFGIFMFFYIMLSIFRLFLGGGRRA